MAYIDTHIYKGSIILRRPHIAEKASMLETNGVYTFVVSSQATKRDVSEAIKNVYSVTPEKVRIINVPGKKVFGRGHGGVKSGYKKAMVYLKAGDTITIA